jgi:hypothetical protein
VKKSILLILLILLFTISCGPSVNNSEYCDEFIKSVTDDDLRIKELDQKLNERNAKESLLEQYSIMEKIIASYDQDYSDCYFENYDLLIDRAFINWVLLYQQLGVSVSPIVENWNMITLDELRPFYIDFQERTGGELP